MKLTYAILILVATVLCVVHAYRSCTGSGPWSWECQKDRCVKVLKSSSHGVELSTCKLTCGKYSVLLPKPSGFINLGKKTVPFLPRKVKLESARCANKKCSDHSLHVAFSNLRRTLFTVYRKQRSASRCDYKCEIEARQTKVLVYISIYQEVSKLTLDTDESYSLKVTRAGSVVKAYISADNYFGARHGLETLSQLTSFKDGHNALQIVNYVDIRKDRPAYPYRGILIDTSRNFFSVKSILRLIVAMSYNKMNTLHWHITDTHSFPIKIKTQPELHQYGAYSSRHVYSNSDVRTIVINGLVHGVRVIPEFDEPAHCGEGWQFGPSNGLGNLAVCVSREPWHKFCLEPPCGQLNPTNENVYDVLEKIFSQYLELFDPELFHAGGDEVSFNCWNTTTEIFNWMQKNIGGVQEKDYLDLWGLFLEKSTKRLDKVNKNGKKIPIVLWSSKMTTGQYLTKYLDPKRHIIQIWSGSKDKGIANIVQAGFKTIFSTYDTLYLDCGFGNWVTEGNNWCSPYKDWKLLYDNDPVRILKTFNVTVTPKMRASILGQESAMWSEQVDEATSEGKIWPRSAALAERLWTNPDHNWRDAEFRMIYHRERLIQRGVRADALQPRWCKQNSGHCQFVNSK